MQQHVTVYSTPACMQCQATKRWLKGRDIAFTEVHLERDAQAAADLRAKGFTSAPVVRVIRPNGADVAWSGFRVSQLETLTTAANPEGTPPK